MPPMYVMIGLSSPNKEIIMENVDLEFIRKWKSLSNVICRKNAIFLDVDLEVYEDGSVNVVYDNKSCNHYSNSNGEWGIHIDSTTNAIITNPRLYVPLEEYMAIPTKEHGYKHENLLIDLRKIELRSELSKKALNVTVEIMSEDKIQMLKCLHANETKILISDNEAFQKPHWGVSFATSFPIELCQPENPSFEEKPLEKIRCISGCQLHLDVITKCFLVGLGVIQNNEPLVKCESPYDSID